MRRNATLAAGVFMVLAVGLCLSARAKEPALDLAALAVSDDAQTAKRAIAALRAQGPDGLRALLDAHQAQLKRGPAKDAAWQRLSCAIDAVAAQRDAYASRLFWYTDLDAAKAAAKRENKPILSLRMLGELHSELSCANSRFFRTTLYPDPAVAELLGRKFILHWKSVRPVPVVTIDFGDGRTVKRTITGNSAHYVLDADGRPIDAIPGLYSAKAFVRELNEALGAAEQIAGASGADRERTLREYHADALNRTTFAFQADAQRARVATGPQFTIVEPAAPATAVPARKAMDRATGKGFVEMPIVRAITPDQLETEPTGATTWAAIARLHEADAKLSPEVRAVVATKGPPAEDAGRIALTKVRVESPLVRMVQNLERSIAEDTVRNEYLLHRRIHEWFVSGQVNNDVESLNDRVYAELFLTPRSDPWLGLVPADTYTGIEGEGLIGG
jgi:hypothetical protein